MEHHHNCNGPSWNGDCITVMINLFLWTSIGFSMKIHGNLPPADGGSPFQSHDGSVCMPKILMVCHWPSTKTPVMLSHQSTINGSGSEKWEWHFPIEIKAPWPQIVPLWAPTRRIAGSLRRHAPSVRRGSPGQSCRGGHRSFQRTESHGKFHGTWMNFTGFCTDFRLSDSDSFPTNNLKIS